jgi:hypothetical protein
MMLVPPPKHQIIRSLNTCWQLTTQMEQIEQDRKTKRSVQWKEESGGTASSRRRINWVIDFRLKWQQKQRDKSTDKKLAQRCRD